MQNKYDKVALCVALCAHVEQGQVKYYKEYALNGRIIGTEDISCAEFVRLLNPCPGTSPGRKNRQNKKY